MKHLFTTAFLSVVGIALSAQISTFPHFTDFEPEATCATSCPGACALTGFWQNADQYGFPQAGVDWIVDVGGTPSGGTGPSIDHTTGTPTGKYVYTETSGCPNVEGHLVSGIYDFSAVATPRISFWYHMFGATMGVMHLDVDTTGLGNWVLDVTPTWTDNIDAWQLKDVALPQLANRPSTRIRIRMMTGTSFTSDAAIDDINVYIPLANDVDMAGVNAGGGCGNSPCTPVNIILVNNGINTINAGTLIPVSLNVNSITSNDTITVAANVAPGDTIFYTFINGCADLSGPTPVNITVWAAWSLDLGAGNDTAMANVVGIPIITNYPYIEDFESGQNGWRINNGPSGTWAFGTPAKPIINSAASGSNCFVNGNLNGIYNNGDNSWVEGPCFDFTNVCDPVISVNVWWNAEFSWDGMNVSTSIDGGNTWQLVGAYLDPVTWYTDNTISGNPGGYQSGWSGRNSTTNGSGTWVNARHRLTGLGGQPDVKIRFNFGSDGSVVDEGVAFDDVMIFDGVYLGNDMITCTAPNVNLTADNGNGATSYLWSTGATTPSITATTSGWYWVDVTTASCTNRDSINIFDGSSATVSLGADTTVCAGNTVNFDAGYFPASTYTWSNGPTTQSIVANTSGTYYVDVTNVCGTISDTVIFTVNPLPVVDAGPDSSYCGTASLNAIASGVTYMWSTMDTTASIMVSTSGTYYVDVMDMIGCAGSDTVMIMVNALPVVNLGADTTQCGGSVMLDAMNAGATYMWSDSSMAQTLGASASGTYSVVVLDSNGCWSTDSVMVTINALPVVNLGADTMACGTMYTLDAMNPGAMYMWNDSSSAQTLDVMMSGMYYVDVVDSNGCWSSDSINVMLNANPVVDLGADTVQCGGSVMLDAMNNGSMYMWNDSTSAQTLSASASGMYYVTVTDTNMCWASDTINVTINALPNVSGSAAASTVCLDDADVALTGAPSGGAWSGPGVTGNNFDPSTGSGAQTLTYTFTDSLGCTASATVTITVDPCVGVEENVLVNQITAYPNPTLNGITVTVAEPTDIVMFNTLGEVVFAQRILNTVQIDMTSMESGVYIIRSTEGKVVRVVKE